MSKIYRVIAPFRNLLNGEIIDVGGEIPPHIADDDAACARLVNAGCLNVHENKHLLQKIDDSTDEAFVEKVSETKNNRKRNLEAIKQ